LTPCTIVVLAPVNESLTLTLNSQLLSSGAMGETALVPAAGAENVHVRLLTLTARPAGTVTATADVGAYKRHVYNAVIRVVNPSSRRE
jgi:hypothetical protein